MIRKYINVSGWFALSIRDDLNEDRLRSMVKAAILIMSPILLIFMLVAVFLEVFSVVEVGFIFAYILFYLGLYYLLPRGKPNTLSMAATSFSILWIFALALVSGGVYSPYLDMFLIVFIVTGYVYGLKKALQFLAVIISLVGSFVLLDAFGWMSNPLVEYPPHINFYIHVVLLLASVIIIVYVLSELQSTVDKYSKNVHQLNQVKNARELIENRYSTILSAAPNAIISIDSYHKIIFFNQKAEEIFGYTMEEVLGKPMEFLLPPRYAHSHQEKVDDFHKAKTPHHSLDLPRELEGMKKDGTIFPVVGSVAKVEEFGETIFTAILTDVSELKRAKEKLAYSESTYQALYEDVPIGLYLTSLDGKFLKVNQAFVKIMGYDSKEEIFQVDVNDIYAAKGQRKDIIARSRKTERIKEDEIELVRKDGKRIWVLVSSRFETEEAHGGGTFSGSIIDITDRKIAQERLQSQFNHMASLRRVDRAISSTFDKSVVLDIIVDEMVNELQVDAAAVLLLNPLSNHLEFAAHRGFFTSANRLRKIQVPLQNSFAGKAFLEQRTFPIRDLRECDHKELILREFNGDNFRSYFAAPLISKGNVIGVLEVFNRHVTDPEDNWLIFFEALAAQASLALDNSMLFEDLKRSNAEIKRAYDATLEGWVQALDMRDEETEHHSQRVTEMTLELAQMMGITGEKLMHIKRGALLHDIGKIGVPDSILLKPGPLNDDEWKIMKQHPVLAYHFLSAIPYLEPALDIPYCHHERWDGSGYPRGLKGKEIPLAARIFSVIDVWDALASDRPYRKAWSEMKVIAYLREQSGILFDPDVVDEFINLQMSKNYILEMIV